MHTPPRSPGVVQQQGTTRSIAMGGRAMERDGLHCAGGVLHCTPLWRKQLVALGFVVPNPCSNPSSFPLTSCPSSYHGSPRALSGCSNWLTGGVIAF